MTIDEFFDGNNIKGSFAANACSSYFNVKEYYSIFKKLKSRNDVQDIWVHIHSIEDEWPYSESVFISTKMNIDELDKLFGEGFPSEISAAYDLAPDDRQVRVNTSVERHYFFKILRLGGFYL